MIDFNLSDGQVIDGALMMFEEPYPPYGGEFPLKVFRNYFRDENGSKDMNVNGAVTPVEFFIESKSNSDLFLSMMTFYLADIGAELNNFGALGTLGTGVRFFYKDKSGEVDLTDTITTNFELVRLGLGTPPIGDTTNSFRVDGVAGILDNVDAYIPNIDLKKVFGFKYGVKLEAGSDQRISILVQDNLSLVNGFDCLIYGMEFEK